MFYIYKITNIINNKIYIGKTNDVERRWKEHLKIAKAGEKDKRYSYLHASINKYSKENFIKTILNVFDSENDAFQAEKSFIKQLNAMNRKIGMNLTEGGEGSSGYRHSKENLEKMSVSHIGQISWMLGKKASEETKEKQRIAHLGKTQSQEIREKISKGLTGKPKPEGFAQNLREINTGKKLTKESREKISIANRGENSSTCKLKENDVISIRKLYTDGKSISTLAKIYNVNYSTIRAIIYRKSWKHV